VDTQTSSPVDRFVDRFDHQHPDFTPDLAPEVYRELRSRCPVAHTDAHGGYWVMTRYRDVHAGAKDHETFSSASGVFIPRPEGVPNFPPIEFDPPMHTALRNLMRPPLTTAAVKAVEPRIRTLVEELVGPLVARGDGDLVAELAVPLPLRVLSVVVGFSARATAAIRELSERLWDRWAQDEDSSSFLPQYAQLLAAEIADVRGSPRDDYLSWLVAQEIDGRPVSDDELIGILASLAIAGHETTMNSTANLLRHLAANPADQERLRADPSLVPLAVEEGLRCWSATVNFARTLTRDVTVDGVTIPAGERVLLVYQAANRDPDEFPDPETFSLDRHPNHHLAFGQGIHFCPGAQLGRTELRLLLEELVTRCPPFVLTGEAPRYFEGGVHQCVKSVPVAFI
jgi:cytochrome P450